MKLKCLIVDDEPLARKVIVNYLEKIPFAEICGECSSAIETMHYIHDHSVDLIFLDIQMPGISGMDFLKTVVNSPMVIVTTAYSDYAVESYEFSVIDYLLKPIPFNRFLKALNKAHEKHAQIPQKEDKRIEDREEGFLSVKADKSMHRFSYEEIMYFESYGNFIKLYTRDKKLLVAGTLSGMEERLPDELFVRVHKSYIVPINRISRVSGNRLFLGNQEIPIGRFYKKGLDDRMQ